MPLNNAAIAEHLAQELGERYRPPQLLRTLIEALRADGTLDVSLVPAGGHNPLEPARFGVPVLMGPHYENFRDVVEALRGAEGLRVVDAASLKASA